MSKLLIITPLLLVLIIVYFYTNPIGRFGLCCFGYTTYNSIPIPLLDIQVNADGKIRVIAKTHNLTIDKIKWLIQPMPEVLIVSTGWEGVIKIDDEIKNIRSCKLRILKTDEAIKLYNKLNKSGVRVAVHIHSTC